PQCSRPRDGAANRRPSGNGRRCGRRRTGRWGDRTWELLEDEGPARRTCRRRGEGAVPPRYRDVGKGAPELRMPHCPCVPTRAEASSPGCPGGKPRDERGWEGAGRERVQRRRVPGAPVGEQRGIDLDAQDGADSSLLSLGPVNHLGQLRRQDVPSPPSILDEKRMPSPPCMGEEALWRRVRPAPTVGLRGQNLSSARSTLRPTPGRAPRRPGRTTLLRERPPCSGPSSDATCGRTGRTWSP